MVQANKPQREEIPCSLEDEDENLENRSVCMLVLQRRNQWLKEEFDDLVCEATDTFEDI